jgi:hypothetical protein
LDFPIRNYCFLWTSYSYHRFSIECTYLSLGGVTTGLFEAKVPITQSHPTPKSKIYINRKYNFMHPSFKFGAAEVFREMKLYVKCKSYSRWHHAALSYLMPSHGLLLNCYIPCSSISCRGRCCHLQIQNCYSDCTDFLKSRISGFYTS